MLPNCSLSANNAGYNLGSIRGVSQFHELADCIFEIPQLRSLENLAYVIHFFLLHFPGTTQSLLAPQILECLKKLCQCYNTYLLDFVKTVCLIFSLLRILGSGEISTMSLLIAQCHVVVAFSPVAGSWKPLCKSCCLPVLHQARAQILHIPNR